MSKTFLELAVTLTNAGVDRRLIKAMCRLYNPEMRDEVLDAVINAHATAGVWMDRTAIEAVNDLIDMLRRQRPDIKSLGTESERNEAFLDDVNNQQTFGDNDEVRGAKLMSMLDVERKRLARLEGVKTSCERVQLMLAARIAVAVEPNNTHERIRAFNACIVRFKKSIAPGLIEPGTTKRAELFKLAKQNNEEDPDGTKMLVEAYNERDNDHEFWKAPKPMDEYLPPTEKP